MVRAGRLGGTCLHVSPWTLALFLACALAGLLAELLVWGCALLAHELAHLTVAAALGYSFPRFELKPYGGVMQSSTTLAMDPPAQATVAVAGPLGNFLLLGLCLAASRWLDYDAHMLRLMIDVNLALALVNLVPAFPLDGGHVLGGYLSALGGQQRSRTLLRRLTKGLSYALALLFAAGLLRGQLWPWPGLLAVLLAHEARMHPPDRWQSLRQVLWRRRLMNRRSLHQVQRVTVLHACTVQEALEGLGTGRYYYVDVVDGEGRVWGSLSEGSIMEAFFAGRGQEAIAGLLQ